MARSTRRSAVIVLVVVLACGCAGMLFGQRLTASPSSNDGDGRDSIYVERFCYSSARSWRIAERLALVAGVVDGDGTRLPRRVERNTVGLESRISGCSHFEY